MTALFGISPAAGAPKLEESTIGSLSLMRNFCQWTNRWVPNAPGGSVAISEAGELMPR